MEHIFLKQKGSTNYVLRGKLVFSYTVIKTPEATWSKTQREEMKKRIVKASDFLKSEAGRYGVDLHITNVVGYATLPASVRITDDSGKCLDELMKALGYSDLQSARAAFKATYKADEAVFFFAFNSHGRAFANGTGYSVIFRGDTEDVIAHEACHLFGARDLYLPELVKQKAKQHFQKSLMLDNELYIDPLTAHLIGWSDTLSPAAKAFLADTASLTGQQLRQARTDSSKNGYYEISDEHGTYRGNLKDGFRDGVGEFVYADGARYVGDWKSGYRHGRGTYCYTDGSHYEGSWKDGNKHGKGSYYFSDGSRYEGEWKDNDRNGTGTIYYSNGSRRSGIWKNDKLVG